jgi:hypothetical protein
MIISHKGTTSFRNNTSPQATHNGPFTLTFKIHGVKSARSLKQQCPHLDTGKQPQINHAEKVRQKPTKPQVHATLPANNH